ncbi:MAG: basic amino acid ABC transporter substrate-binding protein [Spirulina sp.]
MNSKFKFFLSFCVCLFVISCSAISERTAGKVMFNVGVDPTFPPFAMQEDNGQRTGFDIDLMEAIAERGELQLSWQNISFNQLISALENEEIDAIVSSMIITPERAERVAFSRPYFQAGLAIAIRDEDERIKGFKDLKNKTIAVQIGTAGAKKAEEISGAKVSKFSSVSLALHELKDGNIDAVINDYPLILHSIKIGNLDGLKIVEVLTEEYYGIALSRESEYIERINDVLEELTSDRTYENLYRKWFNSEPPSLPDIAPVLE